MKAVTNSFVIDASITVAWCFEDEKTSYAEGVLDLLADRARAAVPSLWAFEVANALLVAERRKRLTAAQTTTFLDQLQNFNIFVDATPLERVFGHVLAEARQWNLTAYDAAYLEVALRQGLPLATLDENLKKAAKIVGIPILH